MKERLERMKEAAKRRALRLENLLSKEKKLKGSLSNKDSLDDSKSTINLIENEAFKNPRMSVRSEPGKQIRRDSDIESPKSKVYFYPDGFDGFKGKSISQLALMSIEEDEKEDE